MELNLELASPGFNRTRQTALNRLELDPLRFAPSIARNLRD